MGIRPDPSASGGLAGAWHAKITSAQSVPPAQGLPGDRPQHTQSALGHARTRSLHCCAGATPTATAAASLVQTPQVKRGPVAYVLRAPCEAGGPQVERIHVAVLAHCPIAELLAHPSREMRVELPLSRCCSLHVLMGNIVHLCFAVARYLLLVLSTASTSSWAAQCWLVPRHPACEWHCACPRYRWCPAQRQ